MSGLWAASSTVCMYTDRSVVIYSGFDSHSLSMVLCPREERLARPVSVTWEESEREYKREWHEKGDAFIVLMQSGGGK